MHGANTYDPDTAQVYVSSLKAHACALETLIRNSQARAGRGEEELAAIERAVACIRAEFARR